MVLSLFNAGIFLPAFFFMRARLFLTCAYIFYNFLCERNQIFNLFESSDVSRRRYSDRVNFLDTKLI